MRRHDNCMSTITKKILMCLSGLFLIIFILAHLLGNLEVFGGPDAINAYGAFLRSVPKALWTLRILTIVSFVVHIYTAVSLSLSNNYAKPIGYYKSNIIKASFASRTMMFGGLVILAFLIFHLAHLTWGLTHPEISNLHDDKGRHDVYTLIVLSFHNPFLCAFYLLAQAALTLHLSHGFFSAPHTLGLSYKWGKIIKKVGVFLAVAIGLAYSSIPLAALFGFLSV